MANSILVAYATRYGSTQEVAERIAATLRESGLTVDVQPVKQVRTLDGYRAVVLGAPLYIGSWLKDAQRFLTQHQTALEKLPVAIFSLGPTRADEGMAEVRASTRRPSGQVPLLKPVAVECSAASMIRPSCAFRHLAQGLARQPAPWRPSQRHPRLGGHRRVGQRLGRETRLSNAGAYLRRTRATSGLHSECRQMQRTSVGGRSSR